jgi:hypothetical protein
VRSADSTQSLWQQRTAANPNSRDFTSFCRCPLRPGGLGTSVEPCPGLHGAVESGGARWARQRGPRTRIYGVVSPARPNPRDFTSFCCCPLRPGRLGTSVEPCPGLHGAVESGGARRARQWGPRIRFYGVVSPAIPNPRDFTSFCCCPLRPGGLGTSVEPCPGLHGAVESGGARRVRKRGPRTRVYGVVSPATPNPRNFTSFCRCRCAQAALRSCFTRKPQSARFHEFSAGPAAAPVGRVGRCPTRCPVLHGTVESGRARRARQRDPRNASGAATGPATSGSGKNS